MKRNAITLENIGGGHFLSTCNRWTVQAVRSRKGTDFRVGDSQGDAATVGWFASMDLAVAALARKARRPVRIAQ